MCEQIEHDPQAWTTVERACFERRSVRKYRTQQVPEYLIKRMLEAGRFAPSAGNCQPWKFLVIRDQQLIAAMERDVSWACRVLKYFLFWRNGNTFRPLAWLMSQLSIRVMPHELHPIPHGAVGLIADGKLKLFHGAPTVILILKDRRGVGNPDLDCGICGQNMVLTAYSLGLSTCWVGFATLLMRPPLSFIWKRRLGISFPYTLVEGITVGYPVGEPNGVIERETHAVTWFEAGRKTTTY